MVRLDPTTEGGPFTFVVKGNNTITYTDVREAQRLGLSVVNTAMAVTIDIGDANNVHPKDKWDVGRRLLLPALAMQYGSSSIVYSGPLYQSMTIQGATVRLFFRYAAGLTAKGGQTLSGFEIAGADNKWSFAKGTIHNDTVVLNSTSVTAPMQVRYAWADNPVCNLINGSGLPASPFQTNGPQLPLPTGVKPTISSSVPRANHAATHQRYDALGRVLQEESIVTTSPLMRMEIDPGGGTIKRIPLR
jgi:hypothetical protein